MNVDHVRETKPMGFLLPIDVFVKKVPIPVRDATMLHVLVPQKDIRSEVPNWDIANMGMIYKYLALSRNVVLFKEHGRIDIIMTMNDICLSQNVLYATLR